MLGLIRTLVLAVIMAVNTVGYTSQITAGFRAVELAHNKKPIIVDHLAQHLAGAALHTALADYQQLQQAQGPGRSLRVPARNRIMDDFVLEALQLLQQQQQQQLDGDGVVQVVHIGCGMVSGRLTYALFTNILFFRPQQQRRLPPVAAQTFELPVQTLQKRSPRTKRITLNFRDCALGGHTSLAAHSSLWSIALQDTKPWRLQPLLHVHWFEIDQPAVMQLKQQLLQQAGAATATAPEPGGADLGSTTAGSSTASLAQTAAASDGRSCVAPAAADHEQQQHQQGVRFPLLPQRYSAVPADLAMVPLAACLQAAGFQQQRPTVWVAEALLYYLPLDVVSTAGSKRSTSAWACCASGTRVQVGVMQHRELTAVISQVVGHVVRCDPVQLRLCSAKVHNQAVLAHTLHLSSTAEPARRHEHEEACCLVHVNCKAMHLSNNVAAAAALLTANQACELLRSMRALSGAGSCLAATCIDAELQQAHLRLPSQHYFSTNKVAWHFSMDELAAAIGAAGWRMQGQPQTAAQLARERYGRETYVALYGGAECCFTAVPG